MAQPVEWHVRTPRLNLMNSPTPQAVSRLFRLVLFGCVSMLASCNVSFQRQWSAARMSPSAGHGIEGRWQGQWRSLSTGHTGRLRCLVGAPCGTKGNRPFFYSAEWGLIFSSSFESSHKVTIDSRSSKFEGTHAMPRWAGGTYTYRGTIIGDMFDARYQSSKDHGTFKMQRPSH